MLKEDQVQKGVAALLSLIKKKAKATTLVDQPEKIDLQFTFLKVPKLKHKTIPLSLPNSLHYESREVCLFVKDLDQTDREYEKTVHHYEDLFRKKGVKHISKIVPMKALRTDYSMPHTKRSLAKAYDLYLADGAIIGMLPGSLGKIFYAKKKTVPVQVNLKARDLKTELDTVVHNSRCVLQGTGSNSMVTVAYDRMSPEEIVTNIVAAADTIATAIPGGSENIKNFLIKAADTLAIPLFVSFGNPNDVELPHVESTPVPEYIDDVTSVEQGKVRVRADGLVQVLNKRTRKRTAARAVNGDASKDKKPKLEVKVEDDEISSVQKADVTGEKSDKGGKHGRKTKKRSKSVKDNDIGVKSETIEIQDNEDNGRKAKKKKKDIIHIKDDIDLVEDESVKVLKLKKNVKKGKFEAKKNVRKIKKPKVH